MNHLNILRFLAVAEGISYLMLFGITMPLKYLYELPQPNYIVGMAHGLLFILYCLWVLIVAYQSKWKHSITLWSLVASLLPFGTFVAERKWFRDLS